MMSLWSWYMIHILSCISHCRTDWWITFHAFSHRVNKWIIENKAILNSKGKVFCVYFKRVDTGCFSHIFQSSYASIIWFIYTHFIFIQILVYLLKTGISWITGWKNNSTCHWREWFACDTKKVKGSCYQANRYQFSIIHDMEGLTGVTWAT